MRLCEVEGCERKHYANGFCHSHYARNRASGSPGRSDFQNRQGMWGKVDKSKSSCWTFTGSLNNRGYGQVRFGGRLVLAHRLAYEELIGPIPDGLVLDHLCRNRACVNPAHLEPVSMRVNGLRGIGSSAQNARKTHCKRGHEFTPENTITIQGVYGLQRSCKECKHEAQRRYKQSRKAS